MKGREIKRYSAEWGGDWIIGTFPALNLNIDNFPTLKKYFLTFGTRLHQTGEKGSRKKTNNKWFETQDSIAYMDDFYKPKLIWTAVNADYKFTILPEGNLINNSLFMITGDFINHLCAILNSNVMIFYFHFLTGGDTYEYGAKDIITSVPIIQISEAKGSSISFQVEKLLCASKNHDTKLVRKVEDDLNSIINDAYGLSEEEIQYIEQIANIYCAR